MVLTRATNQPGADGVLGTADDVHEHENTTSPFVDQNQTYSSHPSHQVFLRAYVLNAAGDPVATGKLITNRDLGADGKFGTADDVEIGGMATWAVVKAQARDILGINLTDADVFDVPLLATDAYGNFIKGRERLPAGGDEGRGRPRRHRRRRAGRGQSCGADQPRQRGAHRPPVPRSTSRTMPIRPAASSPMPTASSATRRAAGTYDNELLDAHYIAGDGRVNENIGLTAVHAIFHSEHNRLVEHTKDMVLASNDLAFLNEWLLAPVDRACRRRRRRSPRCSGTASACSRSAKFGTEMQYQHLVFEEFARTIQPQVDAFLGRTATTRRSIRRSSPSSRTRSIASAIRC